MFKSLFAKLLIGYLTIFIITLAASTAAITFIYQAFVFSEKEHSLANGAQQVNDYYVAWLNGGISREGFERSTDAIGRVMDSVIYAVEVDAEGLNKYYEESTDKGVKDSYIIEDLINIMKNGQVFRKEEYSVAQDTYMVYHGLPLVVDGVVKGAILQYSPVEQIRSGLVQIFIQIWSVGAVMGIMGILVIYLYSTRTSRSLRELERAAAQIAAGNPVEDIASAGDDELSQLIRVFNEMKGKLEHIETMRRDFIAGISHELRTPLTSISGFVQGMKDGLVPKDEIPAVLTIIQQETRRLISLTGEILDLVKMENGGEELFLEKFRVFDALTFIIGSLNIKEKKPGLHVEMLCPEDLSIVADSDRFRQIMLNLLSNAIKYTDPPGKILVEVERQGKWVKFGVIDTGIGIDAEELPFIFERFYRTDKSRHSRTGGAGLGLNIAKAMVEQHRGQIWVESRVGEGTKAWFTMPIGEEGEA
ncbi:MAG: HAMP domain-containing sensor histidine kinase [Clostridiales bacterium]